jgi:hypothetical protein
MPAESSPIFIVGSPRSGTSILTWCLGQHPNIVALEESNWIGDLAYYLQHCFSAGSKRGERSALSAMGVGRESFFVRFAGSINELLLSHREHYAAARDREAVRCGGATAGFMIARIAAEPKRRWVDGTPEYSFAIPALRAVFPNARFIHLIRDVESVVKSMLSFDRVSGTQLVNTEQEAYDYWLRAVRACWDAERAYGAQVVLRMRFSDLVGEPESAISRICCFLHEAYDPACLEPIATRINSSRVPKGFESFDAKTAPEVRETARRLSDELLAEPGTDSPPDEALAAQLDREFVRRARHLGRCDAQLDACQLQLAEAERELADFRRRTIEEEARHLVRSNTPYYAVVAVAGIQGRQQAFYLDRAQVPFPPCGELPTDLGKSQEMIANAFADGIEYLLMFANALRWLDRHPEIRAYFDANCERFVGPSGRVVLYKVEVPDLGGNSG